MLWSFVLLSLTSIPICIVQVSLEISYPSLTIAMALFLLKEPKKAQGAPGARNGQFAKENVIEKQHFGDRLQKLGFWGLQEPKKAQGAPGARNGQFAN